MKRNDKKKLLLLGSHFGSVELVQEAKRMGIYTVVTDYLEPEKSPAKLEADEFWMISTADLDALEKKCREENISAVLCGASDYNTENALHLSHRLGMPFYCDEKAWSYSRDKRAFKDLCKSVGAPVAEDYFISDALTEEELSSISYPVVVKPADMEGSRGVSFCNNREELTEAYHNVRQISSAETVIVEQMLKGEELGAFYAMKNGEVYFDECRKTIVQQGEVKYCFPVFAPVNQYIRERFMEKIHPLIVKVLKKIGCSEGICNVQLFFDEEEDRFYLTEIGYRVSGDLYYLLAPQAGGFNSLSWVIEAVLEREHDKKNFQELQEKKYSGYKCCYSLLSDTDGVIARIHGLEQIRKKIENVNISMIRREGDRVGKYNYFGEIVIASDSKEKICDFLRIINENLEICDVSGNNMMIYFTDYDKVREGL